MDKSKFTRDPQLDSEGFTLPDARCHGCAPTEPCPRSGHCERYESPLRENLAQGNPTGWQHATCSLDGEPERTVALPPVSVWAQLPDDLVERGHAAWLRSGRV
jgi:hypothetical protein